MTHVVCLVNVEPERATFTWAEGPASFEPYQLEGLDFLDFKDFAENTREKLSNLVKDYLLSPENVPQASYELAEAGYELYQQIFNPGVDDAPRAKRVRSWLESLREHHALDTLEIVVESPWSMPWNVVYDEQPDKEAFLSNDDNLSRWKPFWGIRYNLTGGRKVNPLRRLPWLKSPDVLLVVDPSIHDGLPPEQQEQLANFVKSHDLRIVRTKDELVAAAKSKPPELVYWLSHATPSALVLGDEEITPRLLRRILRRDDSSDSPQLGGLAFLNACQTVESAEAGSFFDALHSLGFSGMVGTEHQTVDTFANPLGLTFLEEFLIQGQPIGQVMRSLRAHVPLGLLYGTYCPPDIRVHQNQATGGGNGDDFVADDSVKVVGAAPTVGATLGASGGRNEDSVYIVNVAPTAGTVLSATGVVREAPPLPNEPYRSLAFYKRQDRALFAGRDADIERFATMLDEATTRILVLHGESGVGKSSFLHAGLIPYLEEECLGYRFLRDRDEGQGDGQGAVLFIRATNEVYGQLARALRDFCARPYEYETPLGEKVSADLPGVLNQFVGDTVNQATVRAVLRADVSLLGRILSAISDRLPFAPVLVIDQCEEVFTLARTPEDLQRGKRALDMLRRTVDAAGDFKVILSLRTEYYGRLVDRLRRGLLDTSSIREYLLTDFDEEALVEAIRRPTEREQITHASEIPFEKYGFDYAEGVAEEIAQRAVRFTTQRRDSVLPLVQVICAQLYGLVRERADHTITRDDLEELGGIEGGMRSHVEALLGTLLKRHAGDKRPLKKLFTQLYLRQPDGTLTTALLAEDEVRKRWTGHMPFDEILSAAETKRLLKVNSMRIGFEEERRYVSLGHDALAKIAADWDEELSRGARLRKMVAITAGVSLVAVVMTAVAGYAYMKRIEADRNFNMARDAVDEYYVSIGDSPLIERRFNEPLKRTFLDKGVDFYEKFVDSHRNDRRLRDRVAVALFNLGKIHEDDDVITAIEHYKEARNIQEKVTSEIKLSEKNAYLFEEYGNTLLALGRAQFKHDDFANALVTLDEAATIRSKLVDSAPQNTSYQMRLADSYMEIGLTLRKKIGGDEPRDEESRQKYGTWQECFDRAQQIRLEQLSKVMEETANGRSASDAQFELSKIHFDIAQGYFNFADAEEDPTSTAYQRAIDHFKEALAHDPLDTRIQLGLAKSYRCAGASEGDQEKLAEAKRLLEPLAAVFPFGRVVSDDKFTQIHEYQAELARVYIALGFQVLLHSTDEQKWQTGESLFTQAAETLRPLRNVDSDCEQDLGVALRNLAIARYSRPDADEDTLNLALQSAEEAQQLGDPQADVVASSIRQKLQELPGRPSAD